MNIPDGESEFWDVLITLLIIAMLLAAAFL